jgi:GT2 family glycosyltransferase
LLGVILPQNRFTRRYRMDDLDNPNGPHHPIATDHPNATDHLNGSDPPGDVDQPVHSGRAGAIPVDWVSGACFMMRRSAFEELGGFDEAFFMYAEDMDLCWRARRAGWQVVYAPAAVVTHVQAVSTGRRPYRMLLAHHRSALRFAAKTQTGWRRAVVPGAAVVLSARLLVACARQALSPGERSTQAVHPGCAHSGLG